MWIRRCTGGLRPRRPNYNGIGNIKKNTLLRVKRTLSLLKGRLPHSLTRVDSLAVKEDTNYSHSQYP